MKKLNKTEIISLLETLEEVKVTEHLITSKKLMRGEISKIEACEEQKKTYEYYNSTKAQLNQELEDFEKEELEKKVKLGLLKNKIELSPITRKDKSKFLEYLNLYIKDDNTQFGYDFPYYDSTFLKHIFKRTKSKYDKFHCFKILFENDFIGIFVFQYKRSFFYEKDELYIPLIFIDEKFRNLGIGSGVFQLFLDTYNNNKIGNISLFTHKRGTAKSFYEKFGLIEEDYISMEKTNT